MNCPNCHEQVEDGAAYCGNCGQHIKHGAAALGAIGVRGVLPSYALVSPVRHAGETKALLSLLCGLVGLAGVLFIPLIGLMLGVAGIVLGTISRVYVQKAFHVTGLVFSSLAVLAGLAAWTYAARSDPRVNPSITRAQPSSSEVLVSASLSTPCYSLDFVDELNVANKDSSCDMSAYNGKTQADSTNVYKIYASKVGAASANDFTNLAKSAIEKDLAKSVPDFKINSERALIFAGSSGFLVTASDKARQVSLVEAAVLHDSPNGSNAFIIVHANNGPVADLQILESQWQWK
jgi:hypothetical protein